MNSGNGGCLVRRFSDLIMTRSITIRNGNGSCPRRHICMICASLGKVREGLSGSEGQIGKSWIEKYLQCRIEYLVLRRLTIENNAMYACVP